jgi:transposase-like protein
VQERPARPAFAPGCPCPGRSHRTHPARNAQQLQRLGRSDDRRHLPPFIPTTNAIEALNRQLRKAIKTKGSFPSEDAPRKLVYHALQNAVPQSTRTRNWTTALLAFKIHFGDRVPDAAS